jgi:septal ring factor EnvC (AmiA/AmiB activator)
MNIIYIVEENAMEIEINGQKERIKLDVLLKQLPERLVRDKHLINEIMKMREASIKQVGDFNDYIGNLTKEIATRRAKMEELMMDKDMNPTEAGKMVRAHMTIIKAMTDEKNTLRELRHGLKLLANEEGRFENELAKLENARG